MRFDPFALLSKLQARHPKLGLWAAMQFLGVLSPFNRHLRATFKIWTDTTCRIEVRRKRRVRNHVGSIHAGALFTLGETCAGLVIIRNFPFKTYRPLMSEVRVSYSKQARGTVVGECVISPNEIAHMKQVMAAGEVPSVELVTTIYNDAGESIALATTTWQVKPWNLVRQPVSAKPQK